MRQKTNHPINVNLIVLCGSMSHKQLLHLFLRGYARNKIHRPSGLGPEPCATPVVVVERRYALVNSLLRSRRRLAFTPHRSSECIRPLNENSPEKGGWEVDWVKININERVPNRLVFLIKDTITWLRCNYPSLLALKCLPATLGLKQETCVWTVKARTHTRGSGCG